MAEVMRHTLTTPARLVQKQRGKEQHRRDKLWLLLLLLLMLLSVALGFYLASKSMHPRPLRRRRISDSQSGSIREVNLLQSRPRMEVESEEAENSALSEHELQGIRIPRPSAQPHDAIVL